MKNSNSSTKDLSAYDKTNLNIAVFGCGSFGTALSIVLNQKNDVKIWDYLPEMTEEVNKTRVNKKALNDVKIPENIPITSDVDFTIKDADLIVIAVASHAVRKVCEKLKGKIPNETTIISATKGIEEISNKRMTEVIEEHFPNQDAIVALSGPSHAEEVAKGLPTTVTVASNNENAIEAVQNAFMTPRFRVYSSKDTKGVEFGGSLKNIIAIASGISEGLGFGDNTKAALMTRGMYEMIRFGIKFGANYQTFFGLSGIGDLITTCQSPFGRNRFVGLELSKGRTLKDILDNMTQVAEGVKTTKAVYDISMKNQIYMPITQQMYKVLYENINPKQAVQDLMVRTAKSEDEWS